MIKSMTGYGSGRKLIKGGFIRVEIRTLNHRYLDISAKLPESCLAFENQIKELIKNEIKRGKVSLLLALETKGKETPQVKIDFDAAEKYYSLLEKLQKKLKLASAVSLEQIISFPHVLVFEEKKEDLSKYWPDIKSVVILALERMLSFRLSEGSAICRDLKGRVSDIENAVKRIEKRAPFVVGRFREKIEKRMQGLAKAIDRNKIESDVASFAQNVDIAEEITRTKGHLNEFLKSLKVDYEVGKKLDFITQEICREINTLSAKANDYVISSEAIEIKSQVEKIREQLQNVE